MFRKKGYEETSVDDILNASGLSKGVFILTSNQRRKCWQKVLIYRR
ncbi:MAG: TetR family transcriptional regulator [Bacillota bacterium]|nr:TetR family transcriptional regulator [Bacillota bacterium]